MAETTSAMPAHESPKESVKETLISIVIAFVLAFVFRGFVIEAFVIPTGSMAPTLMGAHMRFRSPQTGETWPVGPWFLRGGNNQDPAPLQGDAASPVVVHDPMTGARREERQVPIRSGDRILVLKYLYALREPSRYDVVVFKNPSNTGENYIKRLIGLPGEQVAIVDGDVFTRRPAAGEGTPLPPADPVKAAESWARSDWKIARKPADAARAVWQTVFDSALTPPTRGEQRPFRGPWQGVDGSGAVASRDWAIEGRASYAYTGTLPARLRWNSAGEFIRDLRFASGGGYPAALSWAITDRYAYDESYRIPYDAIAYFPVSDVRLRAGIEVGSDGTPPEVAAVVKARGYEFRGRIVGGEAIVERRSAADGAEPGAWEVMNRGAAALKPGAITDVEFWHLDQSLWLLVGGKRVAYAEYDWTPAERIKQATGHELARLVDPNEPRFGSGRGLIDPRNFEGPRMEWHVSGGPVTFHRVGVDRDLHYRAAMFSATTAAWATTPQTTITLGPDEFFVCGDNSPQSQDSRLWSGPEEWVERLIDGKPGVVPRRLMLGKAFFVYFPALAGTNPIPMPDFGRLRFIR